MNQPAGSTDGSVSPTVRDEYSPPGTSDPVLANPARTISQVVADKRPGRWKLVAALAVTALLGVVIGGAVTALLLRGSDRSSTVAAPVTSAPSVEQVHTANVQLCTAFATYNSAMPSSADRAVEDVMPQVFGLRLALIAAPSASPEIRDAVQAVADSYEAAIADIGKVRTRGYAQPPTYSADEAQRVYDHAWDVCQLNG